MSGSHQKNLACNVQNNAITGDVAWLGLDDSGAGSNDDHDDWVGFLRVRSVPDGGTTAGLLAGALGCLSLLRKRLNA